MLGAELVKNRITKEPAEQEAGKVAEYARDNGVVIGKGGIFGNILRINPPLCIEKHDIDWVADVLNQGFRSI
jgi:alanine-glyoxylate transaminase/(R)-3-amino-2-methylpropionate-pyruvate transaminase